MSTDGALTHDEVKQLLSATNPEDNADLLADWDCHTDESILHDMLKDVTRYPLNTDPKYPGAMDYAAGLVAAGEVLKDQIDLYIKTKIMSMSGIDPHAAKIRHGKNAKKLRTFESEVKSGQAKLDFDPKEFFERDTRTLSQMLADDAKKVDAKDNS